MQMGFSSIPSLHHHESQNGFWLKPPIQRCLHKKNQILSKFDARKQIQKSNLSLFRASLKTPELKSLTPVKVFLLLTVVGRLCRIDWKKSLNKWAYLLTVEARTFECDFHIIPVIKVSFGPIIFNIHNLSILRFQFIIDCQMIYKHVENDFYWITSWIVHFCFFPSS